MVDSGHLTIAEQIDHTGATYEQLIEQLSQQQVKLGQAAHLRDQFFFVRGEVEEALKTAKDQLHFVNAPGVSTPAKLDRYKVGYSEWLSTRQIAETWVLTSLQWKPFWEATLTRSQPMWKGHDTVNLNINVLISTPDERPPLLKGWFSDAKRVASQEGFHCI